MPDDDHHHETGTEYDEGEHDKGEHDEGPAFPAPFLNLPHPLPLPHPHPSGNMVFWAAEGERAEGESPGGREHEDIMLRRVPAAIAHRFRGAAGARGFTHAQYLAALVTLHEAMRQRADGGDEQLAATLRQLGLGTVSI